MHSATYAIAKIYFCKPELLDEELISKIGFVCDFFNANDLNILRDYFQSNSAIKAAMDNFVSERSVFRKANRFMAYLERMK